MRRWHIILLLLFVNWTTGLSGQEAKLLPPRDMGKWNIPSGNYSGITPLGDGRYALVDDKYPAEGYFVFRIVQDTLTGQVISVADEGFRGLHVHSGANLDAEDVAFRREDSTVWICRESDQRILAYGLDGQPIGRELEVPAYIGRNAIVPNYGFEALSYDVRRDLFWTLTENVLKADGHVLSPGAKETACLRLQSFHADGSPGRHYAYVPDLPLTAVKGRQYAIGVVALWAQEDGSLLIMEREIDVSRKVMRSKTYIHIYKVYPREEDALPTERMSPDEMREKALKKELVASFSTRMRLFRPKFANYEGLCEGETLVNGQCTMLLIADSQNGYGNKLCHLRDWLRVLILP